MPKQGIPPSARRAVFERDGWKCRKCGNRQTLDPHHIIYRSHGGTDTMGNLITLCRRDHDAIHAGKLIVDVLFSFDNPVVRFTDLRRKT